MSSSHYSLTCKQRSYTMTEFWMKQVHRNALVRNRVKLVREMNSMSVIKRLQKLAVISNYHVESIEVKAANMERNSAILDLIPRRRPTAFTKFCQSLTAAGNHELRMLLDPEGCSWPLSDKMTVLLSQDSVQFCVTTKSGDKRCVEVPFKNWSIFMVAIPAIQDALSYEKEEAYFPLKAGQHACSCV